MSPTTYACSICGYLVQPEGSKGSSWLSDFKVLRDGETGILDGTYDASWNLQFLIPPKIDYIMPCEPLFHTACLSLLEHRLGGAISLVRLYEVLRSLPIPLGANSVSWNDGYEGLWAFNEDCYPWYNIVRGFTVDPATQSLFSMDPLTVPELALIKDTTIKDSPIPIPPMEQMRNQNVLTKAPSALASMPKEIIDIIAAYLPTRDALSLRLCSRAFLPIMYSAYFWNTRFDPDNERGFFYDFAGPRTLSNLIKTYRLTSKVQDTPSVHNRRRVWGISSTIAELIKLQRPQLTEFEADHDPHHDLRWSHASGDVRERHESLSGTMGCRSLFPYTVQIPHTFQKVTIYTCLDGSTSYVSGICLTTTEGKRCSLGYCDSTVFKTFSVTTLHGFILSLGSKGIHAIKVVDGHNRESSWAGLPGDASITERLQLGQPLAAIKAEFDGFKLVRLGTCTNLNETVPSRNLREAGLWFPRLPPSDLCLELSSYTGHQNPFSEFEPIHWITYGSDLERVVLHGEDDLISIEFQSADAPQDLWSYKLGDGMTRDDDTITFDVDGAGGEQLETIEVTVRDSGDEATDPRIQQLNSSLMSSITITTTRGRSITMGEAEEEDVQRTLRAKPGYVITGFYATQHTYLGLTSLGIISKPWEGPNADDDDNEEEEASGEEGVEP